MNKKFVCMSIACLGIAVPVQAAKLAFDAPTCGKLLQDVPASKANADLQPINLQDSQSSKSLPRAQEALPLENLLLPLAQTESERQAAAETLTACEAAELIDLWKATVNRSPDIQFVIQRLQKTSDPKHETSNALKLISGALFTGVQMVPMATGMNAPARLGISGAADTLNRILNGGDKKGGQLAQLSQEQATVLYTIIRNTADKLVETFRAYRLERGNYQRALSDMEDLRWMAGRMAPDSETAQYVMDYVVRKAKRDTTAEWEKLTIRKQALIDLSGGEAVARLDDQLLEEQLALEKLMSTDKRAQQPIFDGRPKFAAPKLQAPRFFGTAKH